MGSITLLGAGSARGGPQGFNPVVDFGAGTHLFDMSTLSGVNGSNVTSVPDFGTATARNLTNVGTAPTLAVGIKNGLNAVRFPGTDRRLATAAFAAAMSQGFYEFFVGQVDVGSVRVMDSQTSRNLWGCTAGGAYNMQTPPSGALSSTGSINDGSWFASAALFNVASSTFTRNRTQIISGTVSNVALDNLILGADNAGAAPYTGYAGEIALVPAANVTAAIIAAWFDYVYAKWAL